MLEHFDACRQGWLGVFTKVIGALFICIVLYNTSLNVAHEELIKLREVFSA